MRSPILHGVRPLADYEVDRPEVYARQRVQPTGTNRPRTWLLLALAIGFRARSSKSGPGLAFSRISRTTATPERRHRPLERHRFGGYGGGETPGPIPNPEVKPSSADGTVPVTGWESRSPPRHLRREKGPFGGPSSFPVSFAGHDRRPLRATAREAGQARKAQKAGPFARLGRAEEGGTAPRIRGATRPGRACRAIRSGAPEPARPERRFHPQVHPR